MEPGGILATGLIGIRFGDSFIASVSVFCSGNGEKDGKDNWNENQRMQSKNGNDAGRVGRTDLL